VPSGALEACVSTPGYGAEAPRSGLSPLKTRGLKPEIYAQEHAYLALCRPLMPSPDHQQYTLNSSTKSSYLTLSTATTIAAMVA
jgi:hypothetical protein